MCLFPMNMKYHAAADLYMYGVICLEMSLKFWFSIWRVHCTLSNILVISYGWMHASSLRVIQPDCQSSSVSQTLWKDPLKTSFL
jgi:hypothetical protein